MCLATSALWLRGVHGTYDEVSFRYARYQRLCLESDRGIFACYIHVWGSDFDLDYDVEDRVHFESLDASARLTNEAMGINEFSRGWGALTFGRDPAVGEDRSVYIGFTAPCWIALVGFSVLPSLASLRVLRPRRRCSRGLCTRCGYDLRASWGRCPECGAPVPQKKLNARRGM